MCGNFQMNSLSSSLAPQITFIIIIIIIIIQRKLLLVNFTWFWQPFHVCDRFKLKGHYFFTNYNAQVIDGNWWWFLFTFSGNQKIKERERRNMLHSVQCIFFLAALSIAQSGSSKGKRMIFDFLGIEVALVPSRENIQVGLVRCMMWLLGSATVYSISF